MNEIPNEVDDREGKASVETGTERAARWLLSTLVIAALVIVDLGCAPRGDDQERMSDGPAALETPDWPMYRGNLAGTGYSSLTGITPSNVADLSEAWRFSLQPRAAEGEDEARSAFSQATPIVVDGVMVLPTADSVVALDPTSGREIWRHELAEARPSRRGVAYWPGGEGVAPRILFTAVARLVALDAATGVPVPEFGDAGEIDMGMPYYSVPLVFENIVVVGANTPPGAPGGVGNARAFDARTGDELWQFNSVPQPGELGHDTWEGDSWKGRLGVNAWPFYFTMDEERGHVYLPLAAPVPFAYGGDRAGSNLFANSIVAVDIRTGAYIWHFQTIHHDLWDHDPPAPPVLFDIERADGEVVPGLAVTTKSGYLYILDRDTGEPVYGVEEQPVPASEVPGEQAFATQPIPSHPPALARVSYQPDDRVTVQDTSAEHVNACQALIDGAGELINDGPFTPWVYRADASSTRTTLLFPGLVGGHNWGGVAYDPNSSLLFAFSQDVGTMGWMESAEDDSSVPYSLKLPRPASFDVDMGAQRWPCQKPPWGRLTAVDATSGDIVWQKAVGTSVGLPEDRQNTGRPGRASAIVTASGLVFIASTDDNRFRAFEATSGEQLWMTELGRHGNANPMTYLGVDGKQYVVIVATDDVLAFSIGR